MTIETYPVMNAEIVEILRTANSSPLLLYAAQRIEELEAEIEALKGCDATIALLSHQMTATCERLGLGKDHALHDYIPLLGNKIDLLQRELHDEQVRRDEWEKMYRRAIACGDTRSTLAEIEQLRDSLEAILDEATSDHDRDTIITECQSALKPKPEEKAE